MHLAIRGVAVQPPAISAFGIVVHSGHEVSELFNIRSTRENLSESPRLFLGLVMNGVMPRSEEVAAIRWFWAKPGLEFLSLELGIACLWSGPRDLGKTW